jgi:hypothetical protein
VAETQKNTLGILAKELVLILKPLAQGSAGGGATELPEFIQIILEAAGLRNYLETQSSRNSLLLWNCGLCTK